MFEVAIYGIDGSLTRYREIPGHPGYIAGEDGSIWSCWYVANLYGRKGLRWVMGGLWVPLKALPDGKGRLIVSPRRPGKRRSPQLVHRLVLFAFVGPCPEGKECCHGDGNHLNNTLGNLRWDTKAANSADARRHGTAAIGSRNGMAKMTEQIVRDIRESFASHRETYGSLAQRYGVCKNTIRNIITGRSWRPGQT